MTDPVRARFLENEHPHFSSFFPMDRRMKVGATVFSPRD
jgi:hypothetical protein